MQQMVPNDMKILDMLNENKMKLRKSIPSYTCTACVESAWYVHLFLKLPFWDFHFYVVVLSLFLKLWKTSLSIALGKSNSS